MYIFNHLFQYMFGFGTSGQVQFSVMIVLLSVSVLFSPSMCLDDILLGKFILVAIF